MATASGDRGDLLAAGRGAWPVTEPSALEPSEDIMLVHAAQAGDRPAFGRLYERYARMVHGVLLARVRVGEVDDLVQDVFLKALRRLSTLRDSASFGAWLAAIARNLANDHHRHSVPEDSVADDLPDGKREPVSPDPGPDDAASEILGAIKALPDAYRETLILRFVEGLTGPEIAERTGLTHGSVRVNLHRGMQQLRSRLASPPFSNQPEKETP